MTSADFLQFFVTTENYSVYKTSWGKRNHLHLIYLLHLNLKFRQYRTSFCCGNSSVSSMPYMLFLFVRERFCLRLLSDSASRRTPLSLDNSSYYQPCSGLSPLSDYVCRAHTKKTGAHHCVPVELIKWQR